MQMTQTQMKHYHYTFNIQTLYDSVHVVQYTLVLKILYFHCFFSSFFFQFSFKLICSTHEWQKSLLLCSTTQTIKSYDGNHQRILKTDMSNHSEKATGTRECTSCSLLRNYRSHAVTACPKKLDKKSNGNKKSTKLTSWSDTSNYSDNISRKYHIQSIYF